MTNPDALALAFERAGGVCECIGGGCPALTHRPDINRCFGALRNRESTFFFTVRRFADRTDSENIVAICASCAESPRKNTERVFDPVSDVAVTSSPADDGTA